MRPHHIARLAIATGAAAAAALVVAAGRTGTSVPALAAPAAAAPAYTWHLPAGFPRPRVPTDNQMSAAKVALGRYLFYETRLSGNGTQSCGSCHLQSLAFTDGRTTSVGSTGEPTPRNAPSLANVGYYMTLTWANPSLVTLERQAEVPLFGERPVEMGVTDRNKGEILARLRRAGYAKRFTAAFPGQRTPVTWANIVKAIASFQRTIVSGDSRYDRFLAGRATLDPAETRGMELFFGERAECHHCHNGFNFSDQTTYAGSRENTPRFHNTGLYNVGGTGAYPDPSHGVFDLTARASDMGRFRAPSLRNIALTAPYMHDGSMSTLQEVLDFYAAGGRDITSGPNAGDGRANPFKDPLMPVISLSEQDKADIVAFLGTLTDRRLVTDPRLSDPFAGR